MPRSVLDDDAPARDRLQTRWTTCLELAARCRELIAAAVAGDDASTALATASDVLELHQRWRKVVKEIRALGAQLGLPEAQWLVSAGPGQPRTEYEPDVEELIRLHRAATASGVSMARGVSHEDLYDSWRFEAR